MSKESSRIIAQLQRRAEQAARKASLAQQQLEQALQLESQSKRIPKQIAGTKKYNPRNPLKVFKAQNEKLKAFEAKTAKARASFLNYEIADRFSPALSDMTNKSNSYLKKYNSTRTEIIKEISKETTAAKRRAKAGIIRFEDVEADAFRRISIKRFNRELQMELAQNKYLDIKPLSIKASLQEVEEAYNLHRKQKTKNQYGESSEKNGWRAFISNGDIESLEVYEAAKKYGWYISPEAEEEFGNFLY